MMVRFNLSFDSERAVHVPYWTDRATMSTPMPDADRARDLGFAGSFCCQREYLKNIIGEANIAEIPDIRRGSNAEDNDNADMLALIMQNITRYIRTSRFLIQPHGDTPEREQIYTALHAGTPVVFTESVTPPFGIGHWNGAAITASVPLRDSTGFNLIQVAMSTYRKRSMGNFASARLPFMWGSSPFREHLGIALRRTFTNDQIALTALPQTLELAPATPTAPRWLITGAIVACVGLIISFIWLKLNRDGSKKEQQPLSEKSTLLPSSTSSRSCGPSATTGSTTSCADTSQ